METFIITFLSMSVVLTILSIYLLDKKKSGKKIHEKVEVVENDKSKTLEITFEPQVYENFILLLLYVDNKFIDIKFIDVYNFIEPHYEDFLFISRKNTLKRYNLQICNKIRKWHGIDVEIGIYEMLMDLPSIMKFFNDEMQRVKDFIIPKSEEDILVEISDVKNDMLEKYFLMREEQKEKELEEKFKQQQLQNREKRIKSLENMVNKVIDENSN